VRQWTNEWKRGGDVVHPVLHNTTVQATNRPSHAFAIAPCICIHRFDRVAIDPSLRLRIVDDPEGDLSPVDRISTLVGKTLRNELYARDEFAYFFTRRSRTT